MGDAKQIVTILVGGRRYRAAWRLEAEEVVVESDYGDEREPLNGAQAETLAARLLKEIVLKNVR